MKEAYKCKSADKARKRLQALVSWLERNGYDEAAGSLREGMEETLTVVKLALPALLRQSLATTNAIEISTEPFAEYRETSSVGRVLPWFADGPLLASSPRRKSSGVSKAIAIWALSFTRLEANRNLLTAMSLLPKSAEDPPLRLMFWYWSSRELGGRKTPPRLLPKESHSSSRTQEQSV